MQIVCLDLEGVLVPEIWIEFANRTGIEALRRTTRDEPDYDKLMKYRLDILRENKLGLPDIQKVISEMGPMPGACPSDQASYAMLKMTASRRPPGQRKSSGSRVIWACMRTF